MEGSGHRQTQSRGILRQTSFIFISILDVPLFPQFLFLFSFFFFFYTVLDVAGDLEAPEDEALPHQP